MYIVTDFRIYFSLLLIVLSFWSSLHEISNFFFPTHQVVRVSLRTSSSIKLCEDKNYVQDSIFAKIIPKFSRIST